MSTPLSFDQVRDYLRDRDGSLAHVGGLTLEELKNKFAADDAAMQQLRAELEEAQKRELGDKLRALKVEETKAATRQVQKQEDIEALHEEMARVKEQELRIE